MEQDIGFMTAFRENMEAMGLPVPTTLFTTIQTTMGTVTGFIVPLHVIGAGVTMAELSTTIAALGASTTVVSACFELALIAGGIIAAFYIGAVIGSLLVATWRSNRSEFFAVLEWAKEQCAQLGLQVRDIVRQVTDGAQIPARV